MIQRPNIKVILLTSMFSCLEKSDAASLCYRGGSSLCLGAGCLPQPLGLDFNLDLDLDLDHGLVLDIDLDLYIDLDHDFDLHINIDLYIDLDIDIDLTLITFI